MRRWTVHAKQSAPEAGRRMSDGIQRDAIAQYWVHSHEEDTDTEMVFRPASFNFPRSRGRRSFELKPDGALIDEGIGPTDRREQSEGTWELDAGGNLALFHGSQKQTARVLKLLSVDRGRLVVKK